MKTMWRIIRCNGNLSPERAFKQCDEVNKMLAHCAVKHVCRNHIKSARPFSISYQDSVHFSC